MADHAELRPGPETFPAARSQPDGWLFSYVYVGDDPVDAKDPSGFDATPMYCDSYCQTLIDLHNVMPVGMSVDQFMSYGGNPYAPGYLGVNSGGDQWVETTQVQLLRSSGMYVTATQVQKSGTSNIVIRGFITNTSGENIIVTGGNASVTQICPSPAVPVPVTYDESIPFGALGITGTGAIGRFGEPINFKISLSFFCPVTDTSGNTSWTVSNDPDVCIY